MSVNFDATGQLITVCSAFIKYLRKNGNIMKQCISYLQTSRKLIIQLGGGEVLYNILIENGIPMKLVRLTKMCQNETYSRVQVGKHLSDLLLLGIMWKRRCSIATDFQICFRVCHYEGSGEPEWLEISNGTHQLLVYADDNVLDGSIHTLKKNTEALAAASKKSGLETNADKTKYLVVSWNQNAWRSHRIKFGNNSFERAKEFKYLVTILTNQILFWRKLRAGWRGGMLVIIRCRVLCRPVCCPKV